MLTTTAAPWRAAALLAASLAAMPAVAQTAHTTADDPAAAVPETRYQAAHVQRAPAVTATTPDRNWQESNRVVASQQAHDAHGAHGDHAAHAGHAKPAPQPAPHAHQHDHEEHH